MNFTLISQKEQVTDKGKKVRPALDYQQYQRLLGGTGMKSMASRAGAWIMVRKVHVQSKHYYRKEKKKAILDTVGLRKYTSHVLCLKKLIRKVLKKITPIRSLCVEELKEFKETGK